MFKLKQIAVAAMLVAGSAGVQAATVSSITVTGGHFAMGMPYTSAVCTSAASADFGNCHVIAAGTANTLNAGDTGVAKVGTTSFSPFIGNFSFFGPGKVTGQIAPSATGAASANDWTSGFSGTTSGAPSTAGTISLNLGGFYANWSGTNFLQATDSTTNGGLTSAAATGTIDALGNFDINWHSYIVGGPFDTQTGYWHLTGTATTVPVPAAVWLLGSGLVGLVGVARRRKAA